jgi:hypothetical protein
MEVRLAKGNEYNLSASRCPGKPARIFKLAFPLPKFIQPFIAGSTRTRLTPGMQTRSLEIHRRSHGNGAVGIQDQEMAKPGKFDFTVEQRTHI